jgi:hypothetical protein
LAACQDTPPSTETSTPPTTPPPASVAVPLIVVGLPTGTFEPLVGEEIVELGAILSVDTVAVTKPACKVAG